MPQLIQEYRTANGGVLQAYIEFQVHYCIIMLQHAKNKVIAPGSLMQNN